MAISFTEIATNATPMMSRRPNARTRPLGVRPRRDVRWAAPRRADAGRDGPDGRRPGGGGAVRRGRARPRPGPGRRPGGPSGVGPGRRVREPGLGLGLGPAGGLEVGRGSAAGGAPPADSGADRRAPRPAGGGGPSGAPPGGGRLRRVSRPAGAASGVEEGASPGGAQPLVLRRRGRVGPRWGRAAPGSRQCRVAQAGDQGTNLGKETAPGRGPRFMGCPPAAT